MVEDTRVQLELTQEEAEFLATLTGIVNWNCKPWGQFAYNVWSKLVVGGFEDRFLFVPEVSRGYIDLV